MGRRKGSEVLKEEKRTFLPTLLCISQYNNVILLKDMFLLNKNLLTNLKMYVGGVGLSIVSSNPVILYCGSGSGKTLYCKRYKAPLQRLSETGHSVPFLMSMSEVFPVPFYTLIKLCYTKVLQ